MVQKSGSSRRGRPRAYDPERALDAAILAFWRGGFTGTSLDDLTASTDMNRPSLYAAFGDKQALYLKTMERYKVAASAGLAEELAIERPLAESLHAIYQRALDLYMSGHDGARGCYLTGTSVAAAVDDPQVRTALLAAHHAFDELFAARFTGARKRGEIARDARLAELGSLASGILHTLAIRARAGETRHRLDAIADAGVKLLCAGAPRARKRKRGRMRKRR